MTISIQICIKLGLPLILKNARMVDVSELHNLDYGFEAHATQAFNALMVEPWLVSWFGLPDAFLPI